VEFLGLQHSRVLASLETGLQVGRVDVDGSDMEIGESIAASAPGRDDWDGRTTINDKEMD